MKGILQTSIPLTKNNFQSSIGFFLVLVLFVFSGCGGSRQENTNASLTILGERIFHDSGLSDDGKLSCASCHQASKHFTDQRTVSIGAHGNKGTRNAPSLLDVSLMQTFFWDGRETKLEHAVLQPFTNPAEMGLQSREILLSKLSSESSYRKLLIRAFGSTNITQEKVGDALATYLRSMALKPTRYDRYLLKKASLTDEEIAGLLLFQGKAGCAECHQLTGVPVILTDNKFHHTGVGFEQVAGDVATALIYLDALRAERRTLGHAILSEVEIAELGRFSTTRQPADLGAFRTPTLRNVALTSPYMHDGSIATLGEAVEREIYYRSLGRGHPITLTVKEQQQLLVFLNTLSTD